MKKIICILLSVLFFVFLLTGCNNINGRGSEGFTQNLTEVEQKEKEKREWLDEVLESQERDLRKKADLEKHVGEEVPTLDFDDIFSNANGYYRGLYIHVQGTVESVESQGTNNLVFIKNPDNMYSTMFSDYRVVLTYRDTCTVREGDYIEGYGYVLSADDQSTGASLPIIGIDAYIATGGSQVAVPQELQDMYWRDIEGGWYHANGINKYISFDESDKDFYYINLVRSSYNNGSDAMEGLNKVSTLYKLTRRSTGDETYVLHFTRDDDVMIKLPSSSEYEYYIRDRYKNSLE